jgi:predicted MPP superfamily phosphohydrolase
MYHFLDQPDVRKDKRLIWAATRSVLENVGYHKKKSGKKSRSHWNIFVRLLKILKLVLKITGYYQKGYGNAKTIRLEKLRLTYPNLPSGLSGLKILHLSDLHLDSIPGFAALIRDQIKDLDFDLCVLTGDYRRDSSGSFAHILKPFAILSKYLEAPLGTFAVLGNHDTYLMAQYEKETGVELLINESVEIDYQGHRILITGTDDPFNYYTESALLALETKKYDFKIALVHTSELAKTAAENAYDLYLCGHTHGGQICLKENMPILSHQFEGKQFNNGLWEIGEMKGYTSRGAGVSGMPVRFNCPAEVTLFTVMKDP